MNKLSSNILFSVLLTVVMNGLDIVYHLATDWAVHLNYVAIKLTVIFAATLLIAQFVGKGKQQGIATSIIGPFMFYLYYVAANPTLNREVFKIDEQFWFFFIHAAFMAIAYVAAYWNLQRTGWHQKASFIILTTIGATALDAVFIMARLKVLGFDEEQEVRFFTFAVLAIPLAVYFLASIALTLWKPQIFHQSADQWNSGVLKNQAGFLTKTKTSYAITAIIAGLILGTATQDALHGLMGTIALIATFAAVSHYNLEQNAVQGLSKRGWLILAIITGLIGSFYQFVPRKTVRSIAEFLIFNFTIFGYTIRQNDIVLVSTLLLVISLVSFYKVYALRASTPKDI